VSHFIQSSLIALALIGILTGCTIAHQRQDIGDTQVRIDHKGDDLREAHEARARLIEQGKITQRKLQEQDLSAHELADQLDLLISLNDQAREISDLKRQQQQQRREQLRAIARQLRDLEQTDTTLSEAEPKRIKLESLRQQTRDLLRILETG
jgi:hypothetical protein